MNYKQKYNEVLQKAKEEYNRLGELGNESMKRSFEVIFPELAKSEDERIRKFLIDILNHGTWKKEWPFSPPECISWLEKQKEQKSKEDIIGKAMSYFGAESLLDNANGLSYFEKFTAWLYCEFLRGLPKKLNQEYIKEQTKVILDAAQKELCKMPDSTKLLEMWDAEKDMLQEKDFRGDTWRIAQNAYMDGFARGTCVKFEKQKELFESGRGLYYYDGEKTTYCGYPATEDNPYDFAMSQQEGQKDYHKLYDDIAKSEWFKKAYERKSLGCDDEQKEQKPISQEDMPYVADEHFYEREPADSFKYRLAEYMTKNCIRAEGEGGYTYKINSETILEMAKEELIKRGELQKREEQSVEGLEEEIRRWIHAQRNNGRKLFGWIDMVELAARHFACWGAEHLKR